MENSQKKHPNVPNHQPDQPVLGFKQQKYTKIAIKNGIQWDLTKKDAKWWDFKRG